MMGKVMVSFSPCSSTTGCRELSSESQPNNTAPSFFIWNAAEAAAVRRSHRIVGRWSGTLPKLPNQNLIMGLPLCLRAEEVWVLLREGIAVLQEDRVLSTEPTYSKLEEELERITDELDKRREQETQNKVAVQARLPPELLKKRAERAAARRVKAQSQESSESAFFGPATNEDPTPTKKKTDKKSAGDVRPELPPPLPPLVLTRTAYSDRWYTPAKMPLTQTSSVQDYVDAIAPSQPEHYRTALRHRCLVFETLWRAGWVMTSGLKFGGDFLLYKGDPLQHHSSFVVSIVNENQEFCGLDAIIHGRLARNAKKGRLVATWDDSKNVAHFLDIAWTGWNTQYRD